MNKQIFIRRGSIQGSGTLKKIILVDQTFLSDLFFHLTSLIYLTFTSQPYTIHKSMKKVDVLEKTNTFKLEDTSDGEEVWGVGNKDLS